MAPSLPEHGQELEMQKKNLFLSLLLLDSVEEVSAFTDAIFSDKEIDAAAKRWCATRKRLEGKSNKESADECHAHPNTVSQVNMRILRQHETICKEMHRRLRAFLDSG